METAVKIAAVLAGAYVVVIAVLAMSQTALLFPRWAVGPVPALPAGAVPLRLDRPDGVTLHGHLLPGSRDRTPIIAFGGNAWNAGDVALLLHRILPGHPVAVFYYRGYAPSGGRPSAQALSEDALAIYDHLEGATKSAVAWDGPPVVVGLSIGSGPGAQLAASRSANPPPARSWPRCASSRFGSLSRTAIANGSSRATPTISACPAAMRPRPAPRRNARRRACGRPSARWR